MSQTFDQTLLPMVTPDAANPKGFRPEIVATNGALSTIAATILSGQSLSAALDLGASRVGRIAIPAAFTGTALTFQASTDGTTFYNLYNSDGTEYTVQAGASRSIVLPLVDFIGIRYLKIRSGTSATPTNQAADSAIVIQLVA